MPGPLSVMVMTALSFSRVACSVTTPFVLSVNFSALPRMFWMMRSISERSHTATGGSAPAGATVTEPPPEREVRGGARLDLLDVEGLGDVVHAAGEEGLHLVVGLRERADEDDGDFLEHGVVLQACANLVSVHLRHGDVEEDEVGRLRGAGLERERAGGT